MSKVIEEIKNEIMPVLERHGVIHAAIFGSFEKEKEESDLSILVELGKDRSLLDLVALKSELEETLKRRVDVVTYSAFNVLHPRVKERVLEKQVVII
jgi:predicted nucleotidyltransferase